MNRLHACLMTCIGFASAAVAEAPVLFIAGPKSHGPGQHEHPESCNLLAALFNSSGLAILARIKFCDRKTVLPACLGKRASRLFTQEDSASSLSWQTGVSPVYLLQKHSPLKKPIISSSRKPQLIMRGSIDIINPQVRLIHCLHASSAHFAPVPSQSTALAKTSPASAPLETSMH
jgi:hypothetical protein